MPRATAGLLCAALLPGCGCTFLGKRLAEKQPQPPYGQIPYGQNPYQPAYPQAPYGQPMQGQYPYRAPVYPQSSYGQPGAPYGSPYGAPYTPGYAAPPQPQAQPAAAPVSVPVAEPAVVETETKQSSHPVREYFEGLLGSSPEQRQANKEAAKKRMMEEQVKMAKKMVKNSVNFVRNTIRWVNSTKQGNNTGERFLELVKDITPETAKTIEHVAIPVLGNAAMAALPLTNREKILANFGLGAAMMKVMASESDSAPLFGHNADGSFVAPSANESKVSLQDLVENPAAPRNTTYMERMITHWAARGE